MVRSALLFLVTCVLGSCSEASRGSSSLFESTLSRWLAKTATEKAATDKVVTAYAEGLYILTQLDHAESNYARLSQYLQVKLSEAIAANHPLNQRVAVLASLYCPDLNKQDVDILLSWYGDNYYFHIYALEWARRRGDLQLLTSYLESVPQAGYYDLKYDEGLIALIECMATDPKKQVDLYQSYNVHCDAYFYTTKSILSHTVASISTLHYRGGVPIPLAYSRSRLVKSVLAYANNSSMIELRLVGASLSMDVEQHFKALILFSEGNPMKDKEILEHDLDGVAMPDVYQQIRDLAVLRRSFLASASREDVEHYYASCMSMGEYDTLKRMADKANAQWSDSVDSAHEEPQNVKLPRKNRENHAGSR